MTRTANLLSSPHTTQARSVLQPSATPSDADQSFEGALSAARNSNQKPAAPSTTARQNPDKPSTSATAIQNKDAKTSKRADDNKSDTPQTTTEGSPSEDPVANPPTTEAAPSKAGKAAISTKTESLGPAKLEITLQAAATTPVTQSPIAQSKLAVAVAAAPVTSKKGEAIPLDQPPAPTPPQPKLPAEKHAKPLDTPLSPKTLNVPAATSTNTAPSDADAPVDKAPDPTASNPSTILPSASAVKNNENGKSNPQMVTQTSGDSPSPEQSPSATASVLASAAAQSDAGRGAVHISASSTSDEKSSNAASPNISAASTASPALRASSAADRASSAAPAQDSPASDPASAFDQIVLGLRGKIDAHNGRAEIRLDPPNLGTVRISVNLEHGNLTAQFQSSSDAVRDLLKSNMEKLKTVLESQGVTVDKLAVESSAAKPTVNLPANYSSANAAANDGRSAGHYHQNASDQKRSPKEPGNFSRVWNDATPDAAPIDLVA